MNLKSLAAQLYLSVCLCTVCSFQPEPHVFLRSKPLFKQISNYELKDGRIIKVHKDDFSFELRLRVQRLARAAIRKKNSFSLCLTGGSVAQMFTGLPTNLKFYKWHIFVAEEKIGEDKTYNDILKFFALECKIPLENIHRVGTGKPGVVAENYEKLMRLHPSVDNTDSGCPHVDCVVLGAGVKGRVARLLPDSRQVQQTGLKGTAIMNVDSENMITVSIDFIRAARCALICAKGTRRSPMLEIALTRSFYKYECPAGMLYSNKNKMIWMVDLPAMGHYRAWVKRKRELQLRKIKAITNQSPDM